jgi:hypothetical protein
MPYDGASLTGRQKLAKLPGILRDRSQWPEGFVWDYNKRMQCAMGLAYELCLLGMALPYIAEVAEAFCMNRELANRVFVFLARELGKDRKDITPEDVACAIEAYIAANPE